MKYIPNILSFLRLLLCPVFVWGFFNLSPVWAFGVFAFASVLDIIDGFVARKFNCITVLGKILDPVADKMLQLSAVVCFTINGVLHWLVIFVLGLKELTMLIGGAIISKKRNDMVYSNKFGKIASFMTSFSLCTLFFINDFLAPFKTAIYVLLYLSVILSIIAMVQYGLITVFGKGEQAEIKTEKSET
ncbi:MAG: CDP-alcohol phosphatidyltransferase family protein [Clostridiales bacterium]|nr:CDP-alcohol phosphatidyltransferase family protein [Clostridiales bacterium]